MVALARVEEGGDQPQVVDTLGGRIHVRWDQDAAATPHGQLVFFAEFLAATGVFERWVSSCPLEYRSGNAPDKRDVLGTLMMGMLAGHRRYAHITALRGDAVAAQALVMNKVVSEVALRRASPRCRSPSSNGMARGHALMASRAACGTPRCLPATQVSVEGCTTRPAVLRYASGLSKCHRDWLSASRSNP